MALPLTDKTPFIKYPDGSKDEIMFTAKNVNMYEGGNTVQKEIEDLKAAMTELTETIASLRAENAALKTALEDQMNSLRNSVENVEISKEKIIEALGYEPARTSNWTPFTGAAGSTATSPGSAGTMGLVPAPSSSDANSYLCGDGTWRPIDTSRFLTETEAELKFLGIRAKADSAWTADVATVAYNVPTTAKGNIWIRENN